MTAITIFSYNENNQATNRNRTIKIVLKEFASCNNVNSRGGRNRNLVDRKLDTWSNTNKPTAGDYRLSTLGTIGTLSDVYTEKKNI